MTLDEFNALPEAVAAERLGHCCAAEAWVAAMLARRPFASVEAMQEAAGAVWSGVDEGGLLQAFEAHPKIGDVDSLREKYAATRAMAGGEQSSVQQADDRTLAELARLNRDYEVRHGFIFIVCATGKSAAGMLELLAARINNTRDQELANAAAEQLAITRLRIGKLFG